jgi:hypothetical protein
MLFALLPLLGSLLVPAQDSPSSNRDVVIDKAAEREKLLLEERPRAKERHARIVEELSLADLPEWAGQFDMGSRSYYFIAAAPKSGVTFEYAYDVGGSDRWNHGAILSSSNRRIEVDFALPLDTLTYWYHGREIPHLSRTLILVPWGDRDYLVPEHRMIELCNRANDRSELWLRAHYSFPCRTRSGRAAVESYDRAPPPEVPPEFRKYLLTSEVAGSVISVEPAVPTAIAPSSHDNHWDWEIPVTADVGRDHKLEVGMTLFLTEPPSSIRSGEIVSVAEKTCRVLFEAWKDKEGKGASVQTSSIAVGAKLSSVRPIPKYVRQIWEIERKR